jgi:acyl transferase domain-containing protein
VHLACQSLRNGECNMALAGGVNATLTPEAFVAFARWGMMAPDGRCKTFDADANGFVRGEGCGMIVLKRLDDALAHGDRILAVIRGSAVNQDGRSSGLTVPNGLAQQAVRAPGAGRRRGVAGCQIQLCRDAWDRHGAGRPDRGRGAGRRAGRRAHPRPLMLGSVKTNLGHLESASGIAGLIKLVLCLQHETIPPHLHLQKRNPTIPWPAFRSRFRRAADELGRAAPQPRLGGISGFGFSGTNAHLVDRGGAAAKGCCACGRPPNSERPLHMLTLPRPPMRGGPGTDLAALCRPYDRASPGAGVGGWPIQPTRGAASLVSGWRWSAVMCTVAERLQGAC